MPTFREVFEAVPPRPQCNLAHIAEAERLLMNAPREWIFQPGSRERPLRLVLTVRPEDGATAWLTLAAGYELGLSPSSRVLFISGPPNSGAQFDPMRVLREANQRRLILEYARASGGLVAPSASNGVSFSSWGAGWEGYRFTSGFMDNPFRTALEAASQDMVHKVVQWVGGVFERRIAAHGPAVILAPPRVHVEGGDFVGRLCARGWQWLDLSAQKLGAE